MKAKKFVFIEHFDGEPKETNFQLQEEELRKIKSNEILVEAEYWSVDPYMRAYGNSYDVGITMFGSQVGKILESKSNNFPVGRRILGNFGWRTHTVFDTTKVSMNGFEKSILLEDYTDLPYSLALGVLGMPGNTAHYALLDVCKPQKGDTVVVSSAAGAVGSTAGQIAKIKGCRVIGIAGSDAKVQWLTQDLGFDAAINYKKGDMDDALTSAAPNGVDCYFDNVGGEISRTVLKHINSRGRVVTCGSISEYCAKEISSFSKPRISTKDIKILDFNVFNYDKRWMEGINANLKWIREGKLKYRETIIEGFENMPKAFIGIFKGNHTGKPIVKAIKRS